MQLNKHQNKLFYPLYKKFDREFFEALLKAIKEKYEFVGGEKEKEYFVKTLIALQMIKNYRAPLEPIKDNLARKTPLEKINEIIRRKKFEYDYSWAIWKRDKEMLQLANKIYKSPLKIIGNNEEFNEFVFRYLISIWLVDFAGPQWVVLQLAKNGRLELAKANKLLSLWDFTGIFKPRTD